ncbi:GTP 3',8-cyclase MoaA [Sphingobacterium sp. SRCM116780]|uniref:GTP 3',8-cyclase MoaA n=1 Tax=Sphingobacterium sp. SRCM116780 TaxID=2907623 RepID=UPI001F2431E8|nr:GTP 3',8-cyclase MoaA [Sphingobacterium sp. SRCM116780]UIR56850.1 GTP 3',8-cyclase MoaA [Sphingobacterium sp. SRCM116780]
MLFDKFGRQHTYLRISLTDNCNLRCFYCMPEEEYAFAAPSKLMQPQEILEIAQTFVDQGITKIRLTGGEPFVRKDVDIILAGLSKLPVELTCTTNGIRIDALLPMIKAANFSSMNISLDTLNAQKFHRITRRDLFDKVRSNIDLLLKEGIRCKLNVVVMKGLNDDEILDFVRLTKELPLIVRFIEFMPFSGNKWTSNQVFTLDEIKKVIASAFEIQAVVGDVHDTAKHFQIAGHQGSFSVISTMSEPFCGGCNRIRLTADGKLKNCLFSTHETDLLGALRQGEPILPLIQTNIQSKAYALGGQLEKDFTQIDVDKLENRSMITIGG